MDVEKLRNHPPRARWGPTDSPLSSGVQQGHEPMRRRLDWICAWGTGVWMGKNTNKDEEGRSFIGPVEVGMGRRGTCLCLGMGVEDDWTPNNVIHCN